MNLREQVIPLDLLLPVIITVSLLRDLALLFILARSFLELLNVLPSPLSITPLNFPCFVLYSLAFLVIDRGMHRTICLYCNLFLAYVFSQTAEYTYKTWIGLHRPANQTTFRWSNNYPLDYLGWSTYAKRRYTNLRSCVYSEHSYYSSGAWRDSNCTAQLPFVCKISNGE